MLKSVCEAKTKYTQNYSGGLSLVVQWLGLSVSPAGGVTSIPGQRTKALPATRPGQKKERKERKNMTVESALKVKALVAQSYLTLQLHGL